MKINRFSLTSYLSPSRFIQQALLKLIFNSFLRIDLTVCSFIVISFAIFLVSARIDFTVLTFLPRLVKAYLTNSTWEFQT